MARQEAELTEAAAPTAQDLRCFRTHGLQGVNYAAGTWHHPLIALDRQGDFLVIDREGPTPDCEEVDLAPGWRIESVQLGY